MGQTLPASGLTDEEVRVLVARLVMLGFAGVLSDNERDYLRRLIVKDLRRRAKRKEE